jgi:hypothetical protein
MKSAFFASSAIMTAFRGTKKGGWNGWKMYLERKENYLEHENNSFYLYLLNFAVSKNLASQ